MLKSHMESLSLFDTEECVVIKKIQLDKSEFVVCEKIIVEMDTHSSSYWGRRCSCEQLCNRHKF